MSNNPTRADLRALGMDRSIPRRDFLNGIALGVVGAYTALHSRGLHAQQLEAYPPGRLGLRGQHPSAIAAFDRINQGASIPGPPSAAIAA